MKIFLLKSQIIQKKKKNCSSCAKEFECGECFHELFMLNHMIYKICIKNSSDLVELPSVSDFFPKFYFGENNNQVRRIVL